MATSSVNIKLLIDTKSQKVLFAEAGKDFVDFLFYLLSLPVGTVTRLLTKDSMVGSLGNVYGSIQTISESYLIHKDQTKEALLRPTPPSSSLSQVPLLPYYASSTVSRRFYGCGGNNQYHFDSVFSPRNNHCQYHYSYVADDPEALCPECKFRMSRELSYVAPSKTQVGNKNNDGEGGFVKGVITYMVMDDLVVQPMSTISSITMLNSFNIKDIGALQEKTVHLDMALGVKLLKASLQSKTVLTSVFLRGSNAES